jgi:gamma-glutamylcyclotransferase (GGCT)/AIG2-like uncharacterized protein YtfP
MYVHRMAALVPGLEPMRVEGDLFLIGEQAVAAIDGLELAGPYARERVAVVSLDGGTPYVALAYMAQEPARWLALVDRGEAAALERYPPELAAGEAPKPCCVRAPGHAPPHDVIEVL